MTELLNRWKSILRIKRNRERSRKLDEKLRKFRLYQNIRDAIGGVDIIGNDKQGKKMVFGHGEQAPRKRKLPVSLRDKLNFR